MPFLSFIRNTIFLSGFFLACVSGAIAQSKAPVKTYTFLIYHKLNPGLTIQDALPVEREWKKINQAAVDEGKLEGWYMTVKQFTSNPNQTEYDYVTKIVSREMAIKGASPEAMTRIYGDSIQAKMADLQRRDRATAPVVKMEIWETMEDTFAPAFAPGSSNLMIIDRMRRRNPGADYQSSLSQMKRLGEERIKQNTLLGWDFSALLIPNGSEKEYEFSTTNYVSTMNAVADPSYKQSRTQLAPTFDVVRQEVYRFQEYTTKPNP
ncbi:hypothetical protein [Spirosoma validum]|uniref:Uncharacterized protein n=1 Tax=Spirosoma validum TaxID=2771355 RepID=A0A927B258_9BACT|nr:hypothetical protein [Spirosoma validum]MBD2754020.1 hypothetical protein [Spirosoma validum]